GRGPRTGRAARGDVGGGGSGAGVERHRPARPRVRCVPACIGDADPAGRNTVGCATRRRGITGRGRKRRGNWRGKSWFRAARPADGGGGGGVEQPQSPLPGRRSGVGVLDAAWPGSAAKAVGPCGGAAGATFSLHKCSPDGGGEPVVRQAAAEGVKKPQLPPSEKLWRCRA